MEFHFYNQIPKSAYYFLLALFEILDRLGFLGFIQKTTNERCHRKLWTVWQNPVPQDT